MKVFLAGVMQGSLLGDGMLDQDYRERIRQALTLNYPGIEVIDPLELHPDSLSYSEAESTEVLFDMANRAAVADIVVAYLPTASMGTAQEMVRAFDAGKPIITISPMSKNWFINAFSTRHFKSFDAFFIWLEDAGLESVI